MTYPHNENDRRGGYPDDRRNDRGRNEHDDEDTGDELDGEFPVRPVSHRWGWSTNNHPQVGIALVITEGEHKGKRGTWYATFSPDAKEWTMKGLRALGMKGDYAMDDIQSIYSADTRATAVFAREEYQGKVRTKVKFINGANVMMKNEMSPNELKAFSERMRADFARYGGGASSTPARGQLPASGRDSRNDPRDDRRQQSYERDPWDPPPPGDRDAPPDRGGRR